MLQVDGPRKRVYIKVVSQEVMLEILNKSKGSVEFKHVSGEISRVKIEIAGLGTRKIRIANLAPEMSNAIVGAALPPYGVIQSISDDQWAAHYRYVVSNGIRIIQMALNKHLPSNMTIEGHRALIS